MKRKNTKFPVCTEALSSEFTSTLKALGPPPAGLRLIGYAAQQLYHGQRGDMFKGASTDCLRLEPGSLEFAVSKEAHVDHDEIDAWASRAGLEFHSADFPMDNDPQSAFQAVTAIPETKGDTRLILHQAPPALDMLGTQEGPWGIPVASREELLLGELQRTRVGPSFAATEDVTAAYLSCSWQLVSVMADHFDGDMVLTSMQFLHDQGNPWKERDPQPSVELAGESQSLAEENDASVLSEHVDNLITPNDELARKTIKQCDFTPASMENLRLMGAAASAIAERGVSVEWDSEPCLQAWALERADDVTLSPTASPRWHPIGLVGSKAVCQTDIVAFDMDELAKLANARGIDQFMAVPFHESALHCARETVAPVYDRQRGDEGVAR